MGGTREPRQHRRLAAVDPGGGPGPAALAGPGRRPGRGLHGPGGRPHFVPGAAQHPEDLHAGYAALQWVAAGYTLAFALVLITAGRLADILGRKRLFLIGVAGFTVASLACAVAQSPELLVAARVLQGGMAATMIPQILSLIQANLPVGERAGAFG